MDLSDLELMCDGSHDHKPWGLLRDGSTFATAEERRYLQLLCSRLASKFAKVANSTRKRSYKDCGEAIAANKQPRRGDPELFESVPAIEKAQCERVMVGSSVATLDGVGVPKRGSN